MPTESPAAVQVLNHPDALFPESLTSVKVDLAPYQPMRAPLVVRQRNERGAILEASDGSRLAISCCAAGVLRLRAVPGGAELQPSVTETLRLVEVPADKITVNVREERGAVLIEGGGMVCRVDLNTGDFSVGDGRKTFVNSRFGGVRFSPETPEFSGHRWFASFDLDADEGIFGFGGRIMPPNRKGLFADIYAVKVGTYSGDYGGFPIPFFLSTRGYGVFVNNPWPHLFFDMGRTRADEWFVQAPGGDCDIFVMAGPEFADLMQRFTRMVGRLPAPRRWWMGLWCGSLSLARTSEVLDACRRFRKDGHPVDVVQIDGNWRGGPEFLERYMQDGAYTSADFNWHPQFGDGVAMVNELRGMGIRTVLHVNSRPFSQATAERGIAEGWLRRQGFETVVCVGKPEAEKKYHELIAGRNADGIGCWLQDHGDRVSGEILPGIPSRNLFGAMWARATTITGSDTGDPSRIVFTRGAGIGGQRHCIVWSGDSRFGIDFFEEDIWFLINAGLGGFPLSSCDLAGFMGAHKQAAPYNLAFDPDNLARRLCQSLFFMPTPRTQDHAVEPPKFPWNCPPAIERLYGEFLRLRYRMIPYHFSYLVHAARTGEPIVRPLTYHHRADRDCWSVHDQLYLGEWLIVAPVTKKNAEHRPVYLPPGKWIDFWTGARHEGPTVILAHTPLDRLEGLPVFVKAGAILPSQAFVDRLSDEPPTELWLDIYPEGQSEFALNDGLELRSRIMCRHTPGIVNVEIANALPVQRRFHLRVHGVPGTTRLTVNGRLVDTRQASLAGPLEATIDTPGEGGLVPSPIGRGLG